MRTTPASPEADGRGGVVTGRPLHGRPGTKALPLANSRAVGGPIALGLLAGYVAVALAGWVAAAIALLVAAPRLADRDPLAPLPVLATHLVALGLLPFAALCGAGLVLLTLAFFARSIVRVARTRRMELEAPLVHMVAGSFFLLQAATLAIAILGGVVSSRTGLISYLILLLLGWAGGVTLGHLGKLLSLSLWVWWPPGPRPKQAALYPRRLWLAEAASFAVGVELLAIGALAGSLGLTTAGGTLLLVAAGLAVTGACLTWAARW